MYIFKNVVGITKAITLNIVVISFAPSIQIKYSTVLFGEWSILFPINLNSHVQLIRLIT